MELENWVNSIHSACAAAFARHRGKTGTLHLLQEEIFRLEKAIESVSGPDIAMYYFALIYAPSDHQTEELGKIV